VKEVLEESAQAYASGTLRAASLRAEVVLSIVRVAFCALVAIRFICIHGIEDVPDFMHRGALMLPPTLLAAVFSVVLLAKVRAGRASPRLLVASVLADAAVCTAAIGSNVLSPFLGYRGILLLPETASFLAMVFAAGFRVSHRLAWIGFVANGLGLAALVVLDHHINPDLSVLGGANVISLYVVLFACTAALSIFGARRTERLVEQAALHSHKTAKAEQGLSAVLHGHHDALSLISAALFGVARLKASKAPSADIESLASDLEFLRSVVSGIKEEALGEVLSLKPPARVDLGSALAGPRDSFRRLVEPAALEWRIDSTPRGVLVAGGSLALQRLLSNLLTNAKQGDGRRGATRVEVTAVPGDHELVLRVDDDGPGFPKSAFETSKEGGSASGLRFVRAVAEASGGSLSTSNTSRGGRVTVVLPLASGEPS
jgi:two-component sensor histidine kinase